MKLPVWALIVAMAATAAAAEKPTADVQIGAPTGSFFAILVPDAQQSAQWYRTTLGFAILRDAMGPGGASRTIMLEQAGVLIEVIQYNASFPLSEVTKKETSALQGLRKVGIVVENGKFEELIANLKKQKVDFVGDAFEDKGIHMRSFIVRDNYGNLLQFFTRVNS